MRANAVVQQAGLRVLGGALLIGAAGAIIGLAGGSAEAPFAPALVSGQTPVLADPNAPTATVLGPAQLQFKVSMGLAQQTGQVPDRVQCRGGLELRAGQTQQCAVQASGRWLSATVTAVDDRNIETDLGQTPIPDPRY
ncbi:MAG: DUF4333 domain-containing protein [Gordonia sp. (in: high G+C Gram-positive bacteria)]|uniref:DUF4333 domain-containing protein n=1 Tax=Gordonia sp. (in: high G+C Gram-positive bacteria) TaxID=84139 RepID=UPI003BB513E6